MLAGTVNPDGGPCEAKAGRPANVSSFDGEPAPAGPPPPPPPQPATTHLSLYKQGRLVFTAPAGVGTLTDPTPAGGYFIAFTEDPPQPNPGYGPFIIVTSAHSANIADWDGSGDAVIGIHGPLGEDSQIGTTGARISHGCIRLHDATLEKLSDLPAGTPIDIIR